MDFLDRADLHRVSFDGGPLDNERRLISEAVQTVVIVDFSIEPASGIYIRTHIDRMTWRVRSELVGREREWAIEAFIAAMPTLMNPFALMRLYDQATRTRVAA